MAPRCNIAVESHFRARSQVIAAKGWHDGPAVEVERHRKFDQPLGSESDCRKCRDLLWLLQRQQGWEIGKIASVAKVHRVTVYRRLKQMEAALAR